MDFTLNLILVFGGSTLSLCLIYQLYNRIFSDNKIYPTTGFDSKLELYEYLDKRALAKSMSQFLGPKYVPERYLDENSGRHKWKVVRK